MRYLWSKKHGPFEKEFQVFESPTLDGTSGCSALTGSRQRDVARWTNVGGPIPVGGRPIYSSSEFPISRTNTEGIVKRIRKIADSQPDPDAEGSNELDGEEVEVIPHSSGHSSNSSTSQPPAKKIPKSSNPQYPQKLPAHSCYNSSCFTTLFPHQACLESSSKTIPHPTIQKLTHSQLPTTPTWASTSRRREELFPMPFPASQVFQRRDQWPIQVTREDPKTESDNQDAMARLFRRVDRNSREVIMYANNRTIPGTASEEIAEKFAWYEDELINDFKKTYDYFGKDN
ncbi:hypothetical protein O181_126793 [Austropuccinia psidii MF-1]|uniref:Uncharacterized protein n=1 Tax=Austropuccinia psidii MF-1 TaxID=1389203 RepID=A0A9Q3KT51_9BASI|nr:hypothetical protein [Austropuccinia psidii MF-1]